MIIRDAVRADAEIIARLESLYIDCPWSKAQIGDEIERGAFIVAEEDGELIGYVSGDTVADECELNNIAVSEKYRRRGVAKALMNELIMRAKADGAKSAFLLVRADNSAAKALYSGCGFSEVGVRKGYYRGADAMIMKKYI